MLMDISRQINQLLEKYDFTAKELAEASGMSVSVISRYRSGTRHPSQEQLDRLSKGFAAMIKSRGENVDPDALLFHSDESQTDTSMLIRKFNILVSMLDINMNEYARFCSYDPSLISRVRSRKRVITDPEGFADRTARFLCQKYRSEYHSKTIAAFIGVPSLPDDSAEYISTVRDWLCSGRLYTKEMIIPFTENLNDEDVEDYLSKKGYVFPTKLDIPYKNETKEYKGIDGLKQAELDFLRFALNSDTKDMYLFSTMQLNAIVADDAYSDEWMFLMSRIVRKGIQVHIINNTDRPKDENMVGVKRVIPLYLSGKVHAYYIPGLKNNLFQHHCCCIKDRVIFGEGLFGHSDQIRTVITRSKYEVEFRRTQLQLLLKKARPLMNVYQKQNEAVFRSFLNADSNNPGDRIGIFSGLHLGMITRPLLERIASHNSLTESDIKRFLELSDDYRMNLKVVFQNGIKVHELFPDISKEEFDSDPPRLLVFTSAFDKSIYYTYDEYLEHRQNIMDFMAKNKNYTAEFRTADSLRNFNFLVRKGHWVSITRASASSTHFVIRQQNIREAIENIVMLLISPD